MATDRPTIQVRLKGDDEQVLNWLRKRLGLQNSSDIVRMALRRLQQAEKAKQE